MLEPLAIVCYDRIMPGSQLVNRLQDLKYRVQVVSNPAQLAATVRRESPLLTLADLETRGDVCDAIRKIKADSATQHVPVISYAPDDKQELLTASLQAGATLAVGDSVLSGHLPTLLQQALQVD
jgi:CheY-like chemotaxis protein